MARRLLSDASGGVAIIFGILLPCLLGVSALAIEVGYWYTERDKLQIAADSAAYSALVAYSVDQDLAKAKATGIRQAQASGYGGTADQIDILIPSPDGTLGPNSSRAVLEANTRLFLSALFLEATSIGIGAISYATMDEEPQGVPCMLALKQGQSRSIVFAASVQAKMDCVVGTNSASTDAVWAEGTATLTANCVKTPGTIGTNGGARVTLTDCPVYERSVSEDPFTTTPYWGSAAIPDTNLLADQHIAQGRYGVGLTAGGVLQPGKYGKTVEIDGTVTLMPGIYYFSAGFRATNGSKITGNGVTIYVDQSKVLDIAQSVTWDLKAPVSGPTKGMAIMGNPAIKGGSVRLIGVIGNVEGGIYFPDQKLETESGPNLAMPRCTQIIASVIDVRGSGAISNDCSGASGGASGKFGSVRLAKGPV